MLLRKCLLAYFLHADISMSGIEHSPAIHNSEYPTQKFTMNTIIF